MSVCCLFPNFDYTSFLIIINDINAFRICSVVAFGLPFGKNLSETSYIKGIRTLKTSLALYCLQIITMKYVSFLYYTSFFFWLLSKNMPQSVFCLRKTKSGLCLKISTMLAWELNTKASELQADHLTKCYIAPHGPWSRKQISVLPAIILNAL